MKNYLNFENDIKNLESEIEKLKDPFNQEGLSEVDTQKISNTQAELDKKLKDILIEIKLKKISSSNQLIIIHREFDEIIKYENIIKIFKVKNYGRSKIIFGFLT